MAGFTSRLRDALRVILDAERFLADPVFDADWYRWANPDVPRSRRGAAHHYSVTGVDELRAPSTAFDPQRYAQHNPDVGAGGFAPVRHFVQYGRAEQRHPWPAYWRSFLDGDGRLDRDALDAFLRSGALRNGPGSVLRALPHLLHVIPPEHARAFGAILSALARDRTAELRPIVAAGPPRGTLAGVFVEIVGAAGILAEATLAALMVGAEVGRQQVALPGEPARDADVLVAVRAGALVLPGALALLVDRARSGPVAGLALRADGSRFVGWSDADAAAAEVITVRRSGTAADGPAAVGGAVAIWWPRSTGTLSPASARPRALVVDFRVPTPDLDSGSLCSVSYMRTLSTLGFRVLFVPQDLRYHPRYTPELEAWGIEVADERSIDSLDDVLEVAQFELALLVRPTVSSWAIDRIRAIQPNARVVLAPLDLNYVRMAAEATFADDALLAEDAQRARIDELSDIERADATIVLSSFEAERLAELVPGATVAHVPMARDGWASPIDDWSQRHDLVFIGSYTHAPNVDGILWFLTEVWPTIAERLPDARFVAYGSAMPDELVALASERVIMHGYVRRLEDAYATARVSVVPLRFGAGVKGKVTSTMLAGIPIVSTPVGTEGMDLDDRTVVVADDGAAFADAIVALWDDDTRLTRLSAAALDFASRRFSFGAQAEAMSGLLFTLGVGSKHEEPDARR